MGRYASRLSVYSWSDQPKAALSSEQFKALEEFYGVALSEVAREKLKELCNTYLHWRRPEIDGEKFKRVVELFDEVKDAVRAFTRLANGSLIPQTDAGHQLRGMLQHHLRSHPVQIPARDMRDREGKVLNDPNAAESQGIVVSMNTLLLVARALRYAADQITKDIKNTRGDPPRGLVPGQSFEAWMHNLRAWAKDFKLPTTLERNDGTPAPFVDFIYELNRMMPPRYRARVASPAAFVKRIKRAKSRKGRGTNKPD